MKKIISLTLCVTLLLSTFCIIGTQASQPEIDKQRYIHVTGVLKDLEILDGDFELSGNGYITYGELAKYLCRIIRDVSGDAFGIGSGVQNEVASYEKTAEILVNLLGWEYKAKQKGYSAVANLLKLNDGVMNTENFSRYDALCMIYNALTAEYLEQTEYGTTSKYSSKESTLISAYRDIYEFSGIVAANKWSTTYSEDGLDADMIVIKDDESCTLEFKYFGTKAMDLLGAHVSGFYKNDGANSEVLSLWNDEDCLELSDDNEPEYDAASKEIFYTDSANKRKKISLPSDVTVAVNGRNYGDASVINDKSIADLAYIKLYKTDGKYKAVHIGLYTNAVVQHASKTGSTLGFEGKSSIKFDENEYGKTIFFYNDNGKEISFKDIKTGDVVSIFKTINNGSMLPVIRVYAYSRRFVGEVVSKRSSGGESITEISEVSATEDGTAEYGEKTEYKIGFGFDGNLEIGSQYRLYLDMYGKISYAEHLSGGMGRLTGLFIKIAKKDGGISNDYQIFMMPDLDSKVQPGAQLLSVSDNAKINYEKDGTRKEVALKNADIDEVNKILMHTAMYYCANSAGVVNRIDGYSSKGDKGYLYNFNPKGKLLFTHIIASLNGKYFIECSKHYWSASEYYGGGKENATAVNESDPNSYYGKNYIRYGSVSDEIIVMPDITSPDEVSTKYIRDYYKKTPVANYSIVTKNSYLKYNAFSHDGKILPDYGTVAVNTDGIISNVSRYQMFGSSNQLLVNKVSYVNNQDGVKVMKLDGYYKNTVTTVYTAADKIIDAANSTAENIVYIDEISEGDYILVQCNANGEITKGIKVCDYDPENDIVSIPEITGIMRMFKDQKNGTILNDLMADDGIMNIQAITEKRCAYLGYAYQNVKNAYTAAAIGISIVADDEILLNAKSPKTNPEQYVYTFTSGSAKYYNTKLDTETKRVGGTTVMDAVTYTEDPSDMSRVFVWDKNQFVIYK